MKGIDEKSFQEGYEYFPGKGSSPYLNLEFMKTVTNCPMGDDKGCKLRIKMYKSYIKGWTQAHLDKVFNVD